MDRNASFQKATGGLLDSNPKNVYSLLNKLQKIIPAGIYFFSFTPFLSPSLCQICSRQKTDYSELFHLERSTDGTIEIYKTDGLKIRY